MTKHIIIFLLFIATSFNSLFAQKEYEFANSTPQETVKSHFYFLEKSHYDPQLSSFTLGGDLSTSKKIELAKKLKKILLKNNLVISEISNQRWTVFNRKKYILLKKIPEIYLERVDKKWEYSKYSVSKIDSVYNIYYKSSNFGNDFESKLNNIIKTKAKLNNQIKKSDSTTQNNEFIDTILKVDLSTPYKTILTHLLFLDDSLYSPSKSAKTLNISFKDSSKAEELAIKLKQIYLGSTKHIFNIDEISNDSNYTDSTTNKHIYYPNPTIKELYLEKIGNNWLYSNATTKLINSIHKDMYNEDAELIFTFSDKFKEIAGAKKISESKKYYLWQIYMLIYFILIGIIIQLINSLLIKRIVFIFFKKTRLKKVSYKIFNTFVFTIFWYIINTYLPSFELKMEAMNKLHKLVNVVIVFNLTMLGFHIVDFLKIKFTKDGVVSSTNGLIVFIALIVKTIIFVVSLLFLIRALDFDVVNVLAGLSIGGFALALGAQDTIKNFFGSLMIFADKQFAVGDWITSEKISGTVEEVGLRTTKIRTFHNSILVVPNSKLADNSIDNMGRRKYRRYSGKFVINYGTPTESINNLINKTKEYIANSDITRKDFYMVYVNDFSTYGIEMLVYVFFVTNDWEIEMKEKHELIEFILDTAKELDIKFAIPPK